MATGNLPIMRIVLLGAPGSGKGTQAARLSAHLGVPAVSTGEIFRTERVRDSDLGRSVANHLDHGQLVPDDIAAQVVRRRLSRLDTASGFLLDGFPRTVPQAVALDELLDLAGTRLDAALDLGVNRDEVIRRLSARGREDDTPTTAARRLEEYVEKSAPLVDFYRAQGKLATVDATGAVEDVTARAIAALAGI
jgi:adenylate kinase